MFHVNMRRDKQSYKVTDFKSSTLKVCEYTDDLDEILRAFNTLPSLEKIVQANISVFRDEIESLWEHHENSKGYIVRFHFTRNPPLDAGANASETLPDATLTTSQYLPTNTLDIHKIEQFWKWLFVMIITSRFEKGSEPTINGIYLKIVKQGTITFEIWCKARPGVLAVNEDLKRIIDKVNIFDDQNVTQKFTSSFKQIDISGASRKPPNTKNAFNRNRE